MSETAIVANDRCYFGPCEKCDRTHGGWEPCPSASDEDTRPKPCGCPPKIGYCCKCSPNTAFPNVVLVTSDSPREILPSVDERVAILLAHRSGTNEEQGVVSGVIAGCCVVCGVPWPCAYAVGPAATSEDTKRLDWWFAHGLHDSVSNDSVDLWWADEEAEEERVTHGASVRDAIDKAMCGIYEPFYPDALLESFQRACEAVVVRGDSHLSETTKERAILRNELRARLSQLDRRNG